ncbi:unnamed protein product [Withania somnifera]
MDNVEARRCSRYAFKDIQISIDPILVKSYEVNSRGLEIFSKSWLPETRTKAVVLFCHEYGDTCTFCIAMKLASFGYGVVAMDYPGFGLSEGLHGYIPSFDKLVDDVIEHYSKFKEKPEFRNLPSFLFGESMGGARALKVHQKQPNAWKGAVLVVLMCKTAVELLNATKNIERLPEENDPSISKALYERSSSLDKKLFLYEDACHALLGGEPDEMMLRIFGNIISWLDEHSIS